MEPFLVDWILLGSNASYVHSVKISWRIDEIIGFIYAKQNKKIPESNFILEYLLKKRSIHVFLKLFQEIYEMSCESFLFMPSSNSGWCVSYLATAGMFFNINSTLKH